jgi:hypothetical protein
MSNGAAGSRENNIEKNTETKYVPIPEGPISEKLSHASFISDSLIKNKTVYSRPNRIAKTLQLIILLVLKWEKY